MYIGHFDGASRGNPGRAGIGAYIVDTDTGEVVWEASKYIGIRTNNEAEYTALIELAKAAKSLGIREIDIYGDSQLVIYQMAGEWAVREERLHELYKEANRQLKGMDVAFFWIPRKQNKKADELSNRAIDQAENAEKAKTASEFDPEKLEKVSKHIYIAHGTEDYAVDVLHGACTCPAYKYHGGDCKHLRAARELEKGVVV